MSLRKHSYVLFLAIAAAGCKRTDAASQPKPTEPRVHVETATAEERVVPQEILLTGTLGAYERTDLAANAVGRVLRVFVELGQRVPVGAPIAQLDSRSFVLSQREANANAQAAAEQLASSVRDCDRNQALLASGSISKAEFDRAMGQCRAQTASAQAARARAAMAGQTMTDSTIRAPFAGKIAERMVHVGDYVRADTKVVTLLADDPLRLRLTVPEPDIAMAKEGVIVRFETVAVPNRTFSATLKFIGREVRAQTRDVLVEGIVDNRDGALLPGMFATAHLATGETKLPVIPKRALVAADTGPTVLVVVGERLQLRIVQTGVVIGDDIAIAGGVAAGERVVVDPPKTAVDGALVD
jgi:membrane fusion protein (multidrug efflux system)